MQVFSCEFCKIFKNTILYRTPPVAASEVTFKLRATHLNPFQPSVAFLIETSYIIWNAWIALNSLNFVALLLLLIKSVQK